METNIHSLVPGCILSEDIYKKTNMPIMKKKTVLKDEHIKILKTFLITNVKVENRLVDGTLFNKQIKKHQEDNSEDKNIDTTSFTDQFLTAVQQYKKLFINWQGGSKVDPYEIRKIVLPLIAIHPTKEDLINLHHYGTKSDYIYYHAVAVSVLCSAVGSKMDLSRAKIIQLGIAGLLADAGMAKLPFNVFEKSSPISVKEYEEVKKHPIISYELLKGVPGFSKGILISVLQHQEREDGSGYPMKIKGDKIHLFSKTIAICDIYHAMTSERAYRSKQSPFVVIESLEKDHFGKVDHTVLNHFIDTVIDLSIGKKVILNNNEIGEIIYINRNERMRPMIKLGKEEIVNLSTQRELHIQDVYQE